MYAKSAFVLAALAMTSTALFACGSSGDSGSGGSSASGGSHSGGSGGTATGGSGGTAKGGSGGSATGGNGGSTTGGSGGSGATGGSAGSATGGSGGSGATGGSAGSGGSGGGGNTAIKTVFVILMENHDWSDISGSSSAPYINSLLNVGAHAENYHNVPPSATLHPSEPNYIWLEAGDNLGLTTDNSPSSSNCIKGADHLVKQLGAAGVSWKAYEESMSAGSCPLSGSGDYAPRHNPFVFFDDVSGTNCSDKQAAVCLAHEAPYSDLAGDLTSGNVAQYNFITPNLCHDMHSNSCPGSSDVIKQGDDWLGTEVPKIMASNAYTNGGAIFITWDEGGSGNHPIGMIVLSPLAKVGYSNQTAYSHSSTVRTMQTIFGVAPFLNDAANAADLGDLFTQFP
jgi:hypothetical protein